MSMRWTCPHMGRMRMGNYLTAISNCSHPLIFAQSNPAEYMSLDETYSPVLHRIDQAIRWRAVHPNEPIPPPSEILTRYSRPPEPLVAEAKSYLERSIAAADVKKGTVFPIDPPDSSRTPLSSSNKCPPNSKAANAHEMTLNPSPVSTWTLS